MDTSKEKLAPSRLPLPDGMRICERIATPMMAPFFLNAALKGNWLPLSSAEIRWRMDAQVAASPPT